MIHYDESKLRRSFSLKGGRSRFRVTVSDRWSFLFILSMKLHFLWLLLGSLAVVSGPDHRLALLLTAACGLVLGTLMTVVSAPRMTKYRIDIDLSMDRFEVRTKGRPCPREAVHMRIVPRGLLGHGLGIWIVSSKNGRALGPLFLAASKDRGTIETLMQDLQQALAGSEGKRQSAQAIASLGQA
jgi:hypothetical protein